MEQIFDSLQTARFDQSCVWRDQDEEECTALEISHLQWNSYHKIDPDHSLCAEQKEAVSEKYNSLHFSSSKSPSLVWEWYGSWKCDGNYYPLTIHWSAHSARVLLWNHSCIPPSKMASFSLGMQESHRPVLRNHLQQIHWEDSWMLCTLVDLSPVRILRAIDVWWGDPRFQCGDEPQNTSSTALMALKCEEASLLERARSHSSCIYSVEVDTQEVKDTFF